MKPYQLEYKFDELQPFSADAKSPVGAKMRVDVSCYVSGRADVEWDMNGEWAISAVAVDYKSPVIGEWVQLWIDESHPLCTPIREALERKERVEIQEKVWEQVDAERFEHGLRPRRAAE